MLRQAQHDNKGLFCHSEEQRDEESRGYAKLSLKMGILYNYRGGYCVNK